VLRDLLDVLGEAVAVQAYNSSQHGCVERVKPMLLRARPLTSVILEGPDNAIAAEGRMRLKDKIAAVLWGLTIERPLPGVPPRIVAKAQG
jgi:hypothetical protein